MKKSTINFLFVLASFFAMTACGGKEMNNPADGSNNGPTYLNDSELPYADSTSAK